MKKLKIMCFLLPILSLTACSPTATSSVIQPKTESTNVSKVQLPQWVYSPDMSGKTGAVGIAKVQKNGMGAQEKVALLQARAELAKRVAIKISNELLLSKECNDVECKNEMASFSQQEASEYLRHTVVKEKWVNPLDGSLYMWIVIDSDIH